MCFGDDLMFNQVGFEPLDTDPTWKGLFDVPPDRPSHHFGWVIRKGEARQLTRVRRRVLARHPGSFGALRQEIEAEDEAGDGYTFRGEAVALAHLPSWPNNYFLDSVYRWEDDQGRVTHRTGQEAWYHTYHRAMRERSG